MKAEDFVFNSVYKPAMIQGATERAAKDAAVQAMLDFKRSNYKKIEHLVKDAIKRAKKG